jgi:hypothetical protein
VIKMNGLLFLEFFLDNPWFFLIIGGAASAFLLLQLLSAKRLKRNNIKGANLLVWGFLIAIITILSIAILWVLGLYLLLSIAFEIIVYILVIGSPIAIILATMGFRQIAESLPLAKASKGTNLLI